MTRRAVAVLVVLFVLLFSYLNSLRVYFAQQQQMAATRAEIVQREKAITTLEDERARWEDPDYVRAQARIRLGWVIPGEVGYKVIGPDGKPLGQSGELDTPASGPAQPTQWWQRLMGSIATADDPAPITHHTPTPEPTIKVSTPGPTPLSSTLKPTSSPSR